MEGTALLYRPGPDVTPLGFTAAEDLAPLGMNPLLLLLH